MKISTFFISLSIFLLSSLNSFAQNYSRVKIYGTDDQLFKLGQLGVTMDHGIRKQGMFFISDFSKEEISIMNKFGFDHEILIADVEKYYVDLLNNPSKEPNEVLKNATCTGTGGGGSSAFSPATPSNFNLGTMGGYLKYNEMVAELDAMATQYPNLITTKAPISTYLTHENRPIYHVRISDNPNTNEAGEPKVLYTAIHHAREPMSLMETIFYMWYLLENYGTNDEVTYLVNNTQMYFVPCINPDGYVYNETTNPNGGGLWRKNRRNNGNNVFGVDLNRNYSYGWGTTGTSATPSNDTYRGPAAFSEPETQAMRWLVQNNDFEMAFNAHTYAEEILFPIGTTTAEFAPHHNYFQDYTNHMVELNGYFAQKSSGLYPASGDSDDYMYKVDVGVGQKDTIFAHTPEVGTAFWQPSSEIIATCKEMVFPNLILAHLSRNYNIVKDTDASSVATINGNFNHSIKRLGRQAGPVLVSIEPLLNIVSVGNSVTYNLNSQQTLTGAISYSLIPSIQFGDQIKYILKTDNGLWVKKDTIVKTYGSITLQALEDASAVTNWTGTWSTTTTTFVSPTKSFFDGSTGNYANNANKTYSYVPTIDLTSATSAMISFYAKWGIEADYDFVQFQVSTDGGTTWIGQCGNYTVTGTSANGSVQPNGKPVYEGTQSTWVLEEINLSDYLGQQIKVRFQLRSDGGTTADGFYFDDFKVFYSIPTSNPPVASFTSPSSVCEGNTVNYTDFSTNAPTTWSWNFGDGTTSTQQNPTHTYSVSGSYTVSLTVSNSSGTNTTTQNIVVNANPVVTLTSGDTDNLVCIDNGLVQLTANPTNSVLTGNGVVNNVFDPSVAGVGINTISANYTDANGCQGSTQITIIVEQCASLQNQLLNAINVYPNPSGGAFKINGFDEKSLFEITDFNGKVLHVGYASNDIEVTIPAISSGFYYLTGLANGQKVSLKIAVLR
jgi:carboxypeptidase T